MLTLDEAIREEIREHEHLGIALQKQNYYTVDAAIDDIVKIVKEAYLEVLVAEITKIKTELENERSHMKFGNPERIFRNGQVLILEWVLEQLGANNHKEK